MTIFSLVLNLCKTIIPFGNNFTFYPKKKTLIMTKFNIVGCQVYVHLVIYIVILLSTLALFLYKIKFINSYTVFY